MGTAARLRPEIASAWRRAELNGLCPGSALGEPQLGAVNPDSRLMVAARPVLDDVADRLADTRFSLLLADHESRIVARRLGTPQLERALDAVLAVPGNRYCEETTGTNSLASAYEVRAGIAVHGEEHFLEPLKGFTCHGCPILHPVTGRIAGVLDVTGYARDANPLAGTLVAVAARAIADRLRDGAGGHQQAMLRAYRARTARGRRPVVVFGDDLELANGPASELLDGAARAVLHELAGHAVAHGRGRGRLGLPSGAEVEFTCRPVDGAPHAVLVEIDDRQRPVIPRGRAVTDPVGTALARARRARDRVLIRGEPGSGRTHAARVLAGDAPVRTLGPDDLAGDTATGIAAGIAAHPGLTVVEHAQLLDEATAVRLGAALDACPHGWVAVTAPPADRPGAAVPALAARCPVTVELVPLRHRRADVPRLAREIVAGSGCVLSPAAERSLLRWSWPGNVRELAAVLAHAVAGRRGGTVGPDDLGLDDRARPDRRPLSPLEQAEADTIAAALRRARGNKTHAAAELGISRTTLYRRARALGLG